MPITKIKLIAIGLVVLGISLIVAVPDALWAIGILVGGLLLYSHKENT
jgi:hypothetical protein